MQHSRTRLPTTTSTSRGYLVVSVLLPMLLSAIACMAERSAEPAPLPYVKGSWTLVLLPDVQNYTSSFPDVFASQTRWIVDHKAERNISFVLQEGDMTNNNAPKEWEKGKNAMSLLDGVVPYAIATGNHDYISPDKTRRQSLLNEYYPVSLFRDLPTFGGVYERGKMDNSYHPLSAGGRDWLVIALEWGPRNGVIQWANKILDTYPNRSAIIVTHAYLCEDDTRFDDKAKPNHRGNPHIAWTASLPGGTNDGEEIWQKLASKHANVAFVFCGHVQGDGAGRLTSKGVHGNDVYQILANYQFHPRGGEGYLRLVEFLPDGRTVQVKTYSPLLDKYMTDEQQQFVLDLPPVPGAHR